MRSPHPSDHSPASHHAPTRPDVGRAGLDRAALSGHPAVVAATSHREALVQLASRYGVGRIRVLVDSGDAITLGGGRVEWADPSAGSVVELVVDFDLDGHEGMDLFTFAAEAEDLLCVPVRIGTAKADGYPELVEVPL